MSDISADDIMKALFGSKSRESSSSGRQQFSGASKKHVKELQESVDIMWQVSKLMGVQVIVDKGMVASQNYRGDFSVHQKIQFDLYTTLSQSQMEGLSAHDGDLLKILSCLKKECEKNHNYIEAQQEMEGDKNE